MMRGSFKTGLHWLQAQQHELEEWKATHEKASREGVAAQLEETAAQNAVLDAEKQANREAIRASKLKEKESELALEMENERDRVRPGGLTVFHSIALIHPGPFRPVPDPDGARVPRCSFL